METRTATTQQVNKKFCKQCGTGEKVEAENVSYCDSCGHIEWKAISPISKAKARVSDDSFVKAYKRGE